MDRIDFKYLNMFQTNYQALDLCSIDVTDNHLYVASENTILQWSLDDPGHCNIYKGHKERINKITHFDSDLISCSEDGTIRFWDLKNNEEDLIFKIDSNPIVTVDVNVEFIYGATKHSLARFLISNPLKKKIINFPKFEICSIHISEFTIFLGTVEGWILLIDPKKFELVGYLRNHLDRINQMIYFRGILYSCSDDNTIRVWDVEMGKQIKCIFAHDSHVTCIQRYKNFLISGSSDSSIKVWDLNMFSCAFNSHKSSQTEEKLNISFDPIIDLKVRQDSLFYIQGTGKIGSGSIDCAKIMS